VDAHFAARNSVGDEVELRHHLLEGCASCGQRYTRQAMLAHLLPGSRSAQDRLAVALGLARRSPRRRLAAGLLCVAALAAVALVLHRHADVSTSRAAGAGPRRPELLVFRVPPDGKRERVLDRVTASDDLAFTYRNGSGRQYLLIFGVDEHRHVFWFSPARTEARHEPAAPVVAKNSELHEIEGAAGHRYDGARLDVHALFTDRRWAVPEVEALVAAIPAGEELRFPGGEQVVRRLAITR